VIDALAGIRAAFSDALALDEMREVGGAPRRALLA
jgi:hypothetical protein